MAINGDPREAGAAFAAVMAASLANGGSFDDIMPGIEYFAELKEPGTSWHPVDESTVLSGETPINLDWTYNWPGLETKLKRRASPPRSSSRVTACTARTTPRAW